MNWSSSNLACLNVWASLYMMKEAQETFGDMHDIKMSALLFFNPAATSEERQFAAMGIADHLDLTFKNSALATYNANVDRNKAVNDMAAILVQADKTVADLAEAVDKNYTF